MEGQYRFSVSFSLLSRRALATESFVFIKCVYSVLKINRHSHRRSWIEIVDDIRVLCADGAIAYPKICTKIIWIT